MCPSRLDLTNGPYHVLTETPTHIQYLTSLPKELTKIGVPATLLAIPDYQSLTAQNVNIQGTEDLVGQIWDSEGGRDQRGNGEIIVLSEKFTGTCARFEVSLISPLTTKYRPER
jgi:hypothetical protein